MLFGRALLTASLGSIARAETQRCVFSLIRGPPLSAAAPVMGQARRALSKISAGTAIPVNFEKSGEDPETKADSEYPEWLFSLGQLSGLGELQAKGRDNLTVKEAKRLYQLRSTLAIKDRNELGG